MIDLDELAGMRPRPIPRADAEDRRREMRVVHRPVLFDNEEAIDDERETFSRAKVKVKCPGCYRVCAPLLSPRTRLLRDGWEWVGLSHQQPCEDWLCVCPGCGSDYVLHTYTPQ